MSQKIDLFWNDFLKANPGNKIKNKPESFYFCDNEKDANECADLVIKGIKQATATSLWWFEKHNHPLPKPGDQYIITDWEGNPKAIIETTIVTPTPFNLVSSKFAEIEGEGDKSLDYWRKVHMTYYQREMEPFGDKFTEDMIIICEHFKTIYTI
ncbi:ASCH domain-containing protein [Marinigracilibium pacificum]|uniref:ASCH domain-containing protein n=1 Tax=Marinigracilibium pacificum TaxID=2729599 RepID=A0A848ITL3_9BACT|nr:ASCH domain-containing protein [Marinigracilibium pacificum]NMM47687.1 ASCH domain-containing protein [Marinigracilibium pacificum]